MKNLLFLIAIISLGCTFTCCKSKKNAVKTTDMTDATNEMNKTIKYRLVVSFISKGAGTDVKSFEAFDNYIKNHPKKPVRVSYSWGREGENDQCFTLSELKTKEQINFIEELKKLVAIDDMVFIKENFEYTPPQKRH